MKALCTAFGVDKGASGFGEGRDGQQHIADVHIGLKGRQGHHHIGLTDGFYCSSAVGSIEGWLSVEQHHRLQTTCQHLARILTACFWQSTDHLSANGISSFAEKANCGAGLCANPISQGKQARGFGMVCRRVTQQNGFALTACQRLGDGLSFSIVGVASRRCRSTGDDAHSSSDVGQGLHPIGGVSHQGIGDGHGPVEGLCI